VLSVAEPQQEPILGAASLSDHTQTHVLCSCFRIVRVHDICPASTHPRSCVLKFAASLPLFFKNRKTVHPFRMPWQPWSLYHISTNALLHGLSGLQYMIPVMSTNAHKHIHMHMHHPCCLSCTVPPLSLERAAGQAWEMLPKIPQVNLQRGGQMSRVAHGQAWEVGMKEITHGHA